MIKFGVEMYKNDPFYALFLKIVQKYPLFFILGLFCFPFCVYPARKKNTPLLRVFLFTHGNQKLSTYTMCNKSAINQSPASLVQDLVASLSYL